MPNTASPMTEWMSALAAPVGAPGGGSAAGVMLAIATGLTSMVASYGEDEQRASRARTRQQAALALADADGAVSKAFGDAEREGGDIREASLEAARSSARLGDLACEAVADLEWLAEHGKPFLAADVAVARAALRAALTGASANLRFDLSETASEGAGEADPQTERDLEGDLTAALNRFEEALERLA